MAQVGNWRSLSSLARLGVRLGGTDIKVSSLAVLHNPGTLSLANNVRIDDFAILSGPGVIDIGRFVHISSSCLLISSKRIRVHDFVNISSGAKLYGSNDDYSGNSLIGTCVPRELRGVDNRDVVLERLSSVGALGIILPGVTMGEGSILAAHSMTSRSVAPWEIVAGNPAKFVRKRNDACKSLADSLITRSMCNAIGMR